MISAARLIANSCDAPAMRAESTLRQVRILLEYARQTFPVNVELADSFAARAANKLARVVGAQR